VVPGVYCQISSIRVVLPDQYSQVDQEYQGCTARSVESGRSVVPGVYCQISSIRGVLPDQYNQVDQ